MIKSDKHGYNSILRFLNNELRPSATWSIEKEYPTILGIDNSPNMLTIQRNADIVAHAAYYPFQFDTPSIALRYAAIGSVVAAAAHRGQGHGRTIMQKTLNAVAKQNFDFSILWSDLDHFYAPWNFYPCGHESQLRVSRTSTGPAAHAHATRVGNNGHRKLSALAGDFLDLYNRQSCRVTRSLETMRAYLQIPNMRVAWRMRNQQLCAYAIEGKGDDLNGHIHEWQGSHDDVNACITKLFELTPVDEFILMAPDSSVFADKSLTTPGVLGLIRIHDPVHLWQRLNGHTRFQLHCKEAHSFYITDPQQHMSQILDWQQTTLLFFGHPNQQEAIFTNPDMQQQFNTEVCTPYPFFIWGLDSV